MGLNTQLTTFYISVPLGKKSLAGKINWSKQTSSKDDDHRERALLDIIKGCRENDPQSQEKIYKHYYGYAMGIALSYCSTREDAAEVVNDSFIKVFKNIKTYITSEPFKPWFRKIVVRTAIDKIRANKRFKDHVEINEMHQISPVDIESNLNAQQIYKLLNKLPDLLRLVFNMYEIEGYSHREIARELGIAESSSRTYLTRAKAQLRTLYKTFFTNES